MERRIIVVLLCVIAYMMFSDEPMESINPSSPPKEEISDSKREEIKLRFKSSSERTTKDATWTANDNFKVGVVDNGSNRDSYARYVCQDLYKHGFKGHGIKVEVVDIHKRRDDGEWVVLGEARCDESGK